MDGEHRSHLTEDGPGLLPFPWQIGTSVLFYSQRCLASESRTYGQPLGLVKVFLLILKYGKSL